MTGPSSVDPVGEVDPPGNAPQPDALSRRRLLVGAAGVAGATWAAPAILSVDAVAAATCLPFAIDFGPAATKINGLGNGRPPIVISGDGVDVVVSYYSTQLNGDARARYSAVDELGGEVGDFIRLELSNNNPGTFGDYVELQFAFVDQTSGNPLPVADLSFSLLDVDQSPVGGTSEWRDLVEVQALDGATPRTPSITPASANVVTTLVPPPPAVAPASFAGPVAVSSPDGNAAFQYSAPVDTLTVRFIADGGSQAQQIGIWQLAGCVV